MHVAYIKSGMWDLSSSAKISIAMVVKETEKTFTVAGPHRDVRISKLGLSFRTFHSAIDAEVFAQQAEKESGLVAYISSCNSTHQKKIAASDGLSKVFGKKD